MLGYERHYRASTISGIRYLGGLLVRPIVSRRAITYIYILQKNTTVRKPTYNRGFATICIRLVKPLLYEPDVRVAKLNKNTERRDPVYEISYALYVIK